MRENISRKSVVTRKDVANPAVALSMRGFIRMLILPARTRKAEQNWMTKMVNRVALYRGLSVSVRCTPTHRTHSPSSHMKRALSSLFVSKFDIIRPEEPNARTTTEPDSRSEKDVVTGDLEAASSLRRSRVTMRYSEAV